MANRLSQEAVEALYNTTGAKARVSQETGEVLYSTTAAKARLSQLAVETLIHVPTVAARLSQLAVEILSTPPEVDPGFIASVTVVHPPTLVADIGVPFIASTTVVHAPALSHAEVDVPFIASKTRVYDVFSLFYDFTANGPGNGGEVFGLRLNKNGLTETATLAASINATQTLLELTGDSGLPTDHPFVVTIDDEVLYVVPLGGGAYRVRGRGVSNTTADAHTAGADVTWNDTYEMAIEATNIIATSFTTDVTGSVVDYHGFLICFDASQAYVGSDRYPMHVTEFVGVFDAGAGITGTNRCDASQPNAIATPTGISDDCPAALSNPSLLTSNVLPGDVAIVRYTNPEATDFVDVGPRSVALQSWFGLKRVDDTDNDVTLTDPTGHVVDTDTGVGPFTGTVNGEWAPPVSGPGIAPDTGLPTPHDVPYTSVTLPGTDRFFTFGSPGYEENGWPICVITVRQGNRRVPKGESWDWHNFNYVYNGFGVDCTFAQMLINRNGTMLFDSVPEVFLPGTQDIDGPDAVWDDGSYYFGASWYVALLGQPFLIVGPGLGGQTILDLTPGGPIGTLHWTDDPTIPTFIPPSHPEVEGGVWGDINPPAVKLFDVQHV